MGRDPPSGQARLEVFCSLMDEYDSLAEAFAVEQGSLNFGGPLRPPPDRWHRTVRAMAFRKFVLARTDAMYCPTVIGSLEACLVDEPDRAVVDALRERFERIATSEMARAHSWVCDRR